MRMWSSREDTCGAPGSTLCPLPTINNINSPLCPSFKYMPPTSTSPHDMLPSIKEIDDQIKHHASEIVRLQRLRNSLVPACRLPVELIQHVFRYCSPPHYDEQHEHSLSVANVCTSWRAAALSTPELWSAVFHTDGATHIEGINMMIRRAEHAKLSLDFSHWFLDAFPPISERMPDLVGRAHTLRIHGANLTAPAVTRLFPEEVVKPYLETLEISDCYTGVEANIFVEWEDIEPLFCNPSFHGLRNLTIRRNSIQPGVFVTENLRTLTLLSFDVPFFVEGMYTTLRKTPRLEELRLQTCLEASIAEAQLADPVIKLPYLKRMSIHDYALLHGSSHRVSRLLRCDIWS
jgi:hypothetical protein